MINHEDRRRYTVSITPLGQKIIDDNRPGAIEIASNHRARLGEKNLENLLDLLE